MSKVFVGIDPGASGGLASLYFDGGYDNELVRMPTTERDVWNWIENQSETMPGNLFAVIEKVGGFVSGNPTPGSAMFKFGRNVGVLVGCLIAAGIPFEEVTPQKWMKEFGIARRKDEPKTAFKNRIKAVAQSLFPTETITLATCDALLIAEYARRTHK